MNTIELIDVLWLQGNAIVAAFEVESTTSIYSGLLRMSDLVAMQPNLNIPLWGNGDGSIYLWFGGRNNTTLPFMSLSSVISFGAGPAHARGPTQPPPR